MCAQWHMHLAIQLAHLAPAGAADPSRGEFFGPTLDPADVQGNQ